MGEPLSCSEKAHNSSEIANKREKVSWENKYFLQLGKKSFYLTNTDNADCADKTNYQLHSSVLSKISLFEKTYSMLSVI